MKSQNTQNKLKFEKNSLVELNGLQMKTINGGSTIVGGETCSGCICITVTQQLMAN